MGIQQIIDKIAKEYIPTENELVTILNANAEESQYLFSVADRIREQYCQKEVHIRGIIEFSNYCRCRCLYCGLNRDNKQIQRYRMDPDEIIDNAKEAYAVGYKTLVLQSGEDPWYTREKISYVIKKIKEIGDLAITLSLGERDIEDYRQWRKDGADRYLIKHETADEELYNRLHPHSSYQNRINALRSLKELGYELGSGFMIGLPGQTAKTIAKDILLLKELDVEMAGIGPFIPHPLTALKNHQKGSTYLTLKAVALARIIIKKVHLPATTALGVVNEQDQDHAFRTGANVIMCKVEPYKYRELYDIYPKSEKKEKNLNQEWQELEHFFKKIGRDIARDHGSSLK